MARQPNTDRVGLLFFHPSRSSEFLIMSSLKVAPRHKRVAKTRALFACILVRGPWFCITFRASFLDGQRTVL